jgi:MFS family permease
VIRRAVHAWAGGLPRTFWALFAGTFVNRVGTFVEPFLALYLTTARHLSIGTAGALVAVAGGGSIFAQPLGGALADRVGRRPTLCGGLLASAAAIALLAVSRDLWLLALAAALAGLTSEIYRPASQATVADIVPIVDRRRAAGLLFWAVNLGFSAAAIAGGFLAAGGYGLLFAVDTITCVAYAVVVWRTIPETRPAAAAHRDAPGWGAVLRDRAAMAYFALNLGVATVYATTFTILPLAMRADGHPPAVYGAVVAVNGVLIVALHPLVGTLLLRMRPMRVLAVGALLSGVAMAIVAGAEGVTAYVAAIVFITLGEIANASTGPGLVAELAPPALRGRYSGAYGLTWGLAFTIAPLAGAPLLGAGGDAPTPWIAAAALSVVVAAGLVLIGPALERRRGRAAAAAEAEEGHAEAAAA